jgi:hypothetical protein
MVGDLGIPPFRKKREKGGATSVVVSQRVGQPLDLGHPPGEGTRPSRAKVLLYRPCSRVILSTCVFKN